MLKNAISYGEAVWDIFPDNRVPGGATMNVALRLASLGIPTKMISAVGNDELGIELLEVFKKYGINTKFIRIHPSLETGKVFVKLDSLGNGSYTITYPSSWDEIIVSEEIKDAVKESDALIFGSITCRNIITADTLRQLLPLARYKVFDINLRPPYYTLELLKELFEKSDLIKLNDDELRIFGGKMGCTSTDLKELTQFLSNKNKEAVFCITKGEHGAFIYANGIFYDHPGFKIKVADTVGAGDGFLAGLVSRILKGDEWQDSLTYACAIGALVASKPTATPVISEEEIREMLGGKEKCIV